MKDCCFKCSQIEEAPINRQLPYVFNAHINMTEASNASSWGDMVRAIDAERKKLPWNPAATAPVQRVSLVERKMMEREFDPVSTQFRDPLRESDYQLTKSSKIMDRTLREVDQKRSKFNIVSHQGPQRKIDLAPKVQEMKPKIGNPRGWHILSHLKEDDHFTAPLQYQEELTLEKLKRPPVLGHLLGPQPRDFSILHNKYIHSNEEKEHQEHERVKKHVTKKFWETHDYDFLRGRYYDEEKEQDFTDQREMLQRVHGKAKETRFPPSVLYSEGMTYNIMNNTVVNEQRLQVTTSMADRPIHKIKDRDMQKWMHEVGDAKAALKDERNLNRPSFKRWETQIDRRYDIVTNLPDNNPELPYPCRSPGVWDRLELTLKDHSHPGATLLPNTSSQVPVTASSQVRPNRNVSGKLSIRPMPVLGKSHHEPYSHHPHHHHHGVVQTNGISGHDSLDAGSSHSLFSHSTQDSVAPSLPPKVTHTGNDASMVRAATTGGGGFTSRRALATDRSVMESARGSIGSAPLESSRYSSRQQSRVPSLDLTMAEQPEPVVYTEPKIGAPGQPVAMVRTGGLSGIKPGK